MLPFGVNCGLQFAGLRRKERKVLSYGILLYVESDFGTTSNLRPLRR